MVRRRLLVLPLLLGACAATVPPAEPPAPPPRRALPATLPGRVRQEAWITRFWEQLTPSQRRRVLGRLRRGEPPAASTAAEAAPLWDSLGLPERDALVFGAGLPRPAGHTETAADATTGP